MDFCTSLFGLIISSYREALGPRMMCSVAISERLKSGRDQEFWLHYHCGSFKLQSCVRVLFGNLETLNLQMLAFPLACCNHSPLSATNGRRVARPKLP